MTRHLKLLALLALAIIGAALIVDWILSRPEAQHRLAALAAKQVTTKLERNRRLADEKVLRVLLCGTGSPLANPERAGPCAAVIAGGEIWLIDVGGGSWKNLMLWQIPGERLRGVLLTHFHSDHIQDLGEVNMQSWAIGRPGPLELFGGPGVGDIAAGFMAAYAPDKAHRVAHHGAEMMTDAAYPIVPTVVANKDGKALGEGETAVVFERNGLKVTAIGVNHFPVAPAYAYRFDYRGRSVVVSGDTRFSPALAVAAKGADAILHEAQAQDLVAILEKTMGQANNPRLAHIFADIPSYHASPAEAAHIANAAGARLLVLTHLTPPLPRWLAERVFLSQAATVRPAGTALAHDGLLISLPSDSSAIDLSSLD